MEALANLGIDWKLFLAQAVNFLILLFILRRYAYRPMLEFLEKRSDRIEKGLKDAEAATKKLSEMGEKEKKVLKDARHEAKALIEAAEISAKKRDAERLAETELKTKRFLEEVRTKIEDEKKKSIAEVKQEIAEVVALSVEKILKEKVDKAKDREIIEKMIE
ncbi:MAG: ATP synthase F0 subunit B [Candidatus Moranbacteria bacterium RIFCSPLOWO2_02_FULL_48_19]|nr:MAG: ATP synthase F0 subunit B [Candidatus Moranbacteria bacterium RIFCSPLOWO2_02_FULL_48_19]